MHELYLVSVTLHVLAAMVWTGGAAFVALVLVPAARRPEHQAVRASLLAWTGRRFRAVGWTCLAVLAVTGVFQVAWRGYGWADLVTGTLFAGHFGRRLAVKLALVAALLVVSAVHDFVVGPRTAALLAADPEGPAAARARRAASRAGRLGFALTVATVVAAVALVRG